MTDNRTLNWIFFLEMGGLTIRDKKPSKTVDKNIETGFVREGMAELVCFALVNPGRCFQIDAWSPLEGKKRGVVL